MKEVFEELKRLEPDLIPHSHAAMTYIRITALSVSSPGTRFATTHPRVRDPEGRRRLGTPNLFVPVREELAREKVERLIESFARPA